MSDKKSHNFNLREFKFNLSEEIRRLRQEKGLSVEDLAKKMHIDVNLLYDIETGTYGDWPTIFKVAKYFNKKVRLIFY